MCTNIIIKSTENDLFFGRTMDFAFNPFDVNTKISIVPKNYTIEAMSGTWTSKYRFMGLNMNESFFFFDGINEAGLVGDLQYLEECSWSSKESLAERDLQPLYGPEVVAFILSNFETVEEVAHEMKKYGLVEETQQIGTINGIQIPDSVPLHYTFSDPSGKSIVLEPTENGAFKLFENTIGIMTNSPTYDWHMTNLRNYIELNNANRGSLKLNDTLEIKQIESGSGLLGMPGDYTAPSRFIRATFLSNFMEAFSSEDGINRLYKVFHSFIIPKGVEKMGTATTASDFTGYWVGYDVTNQTLYVQPDDETSFTIATLKGTGQTEIETFDVNHKLVATQVN